MKNFTDMIKKTRQKLALRPRVKTTTKLFLVFTACTMICVAATLFFIFNLSNPEEIFGASYTRDATTGNIEVPREKFISDFEVKIMDTKNTAFKNDASVQYKKVQPEHAE